MSRDHEPPAAARRTFEPQVRGESTYDRVSSLLMAFVVGAFLVVGWLALIYATNQAYASRVTAPLEIVEVFGGGGGSPDGTAGSTEKIDVAGAEAAAQASNNEEDAGDFEEPSVEETPAAMLDAVAEAGESLAEVDLGAVMPSGGPVASGRRASKLGTGGPGLGFGPGDGGVSREQRWSIIYNPGQTLDEYARQLDGLGVELAVVSGKDQLTYVSRFSQAVPAKRSVRAGRRPALLPLAGPGAEGVRRGPARRRRASTSARGSSSSSIPRRSRTRSPSSRSATGAGSPARSASPGSASSPRGRLWLRGPGPGDVALTPPRDRLSSGRASLAVRVSILHPP